ncbi:MAG: saccharopine dehydrogenase family protein [Chloroflexota bacterium]
MAERFLIYGANGYTARLIIAEALQRGLSPLLAGRGRAPLDLIAQRTGLDYRVFTLEDAAARDAALAEVSVVLNCAGPFMRTARTLAGACLRAGVHYLDITGEWGVYEMLSRRTASARAAGVMLMPGVGFDVVPSDCLAAHLKRRLPSASELELAFTGGLRVSRGTARTALAGANYGGLVRRAGELCPEPLAARVRRVDFGRGPEEVASIPWGDVASAYYSTGIPNITVYTGMGGASRSLLRLASRYSGLLRSPLVRRLSEAWLRRLPPGPTAAERARGQSLLWGEVSDGQGRRAAARLRTPEGYTLTARTALAVVEHVLRGEAPPGYQTPSLAYGADFILGFPGVEREDVV